MLCTVCSLSATLPFGNITYPSKPEPAQHRFDTPDDATIQSFNCSRLRNMGSHSKTRRSSGSSKNRLSSTSSSSSSGSDSESPDETRSRRHRSGARHRHHRSRREMDRDRHEKPSSSSSWKKRSSRRDEDEGKRRRRKKARRHAKRSRSEEASSDSDSYSFHSHSDSEPKPEVFLRGMLERFPNIAGDLEQLLKMIDSGQAVDIRGIPNKPLVKLLKELFCSLKLRQDDGVFLLPPKRPPTWEVVGPLLCSHGKPINTSQCGTPDNTQSPKLYQECGRNKEESHVGELAELPGKCEISEPQRRRLIGPEMPSSELLAAAAELTEADAALRDAEFEADDGLFIGPPPPAVAAEAESANEAERFEVVTRILGAEIGKPYDVLGVNHKMSFENMKKRYWKLSLMVHPDKCAHPQAHQAFVTLNQAFKELQDPKKRKEIDEKIRLKEAEEAVKAELKTLREAAQWRRLQGISMEGDDELLAEPKQPQTRDEWMTKLPPERKPGGMPMQSTSFSRTGKEGRGDTSLWTDSPLEKSDKAKQNYLEAYSRATALAAADHEKTKMGSDGDLVDKYNQSKRSKSLVQKHREESSREKKKSKKAPEKEEEWVGQHPWKPWDREKDLTAGRQKVQLDSDNMTQGLTSRFSSGAVQRNFL